MVLASTCTPALIYIIFSLVQIILDISKGLYNTALVKFFVSFVFSLLLNILCKRGLSIISWFIVFIPFILMSIVISILLFVIGLDPSTGSITSNGKNITNNINDNKLQTQFTQLKKDYAALNETVNTNTLSSDTSKHNTQQDYDYFKK
uniref:Uncharacterized protein n=1 Tax=viral metagenome TaxID=1070528 RepID=A0A6C0KG95_9ZZZZ